MKRRGALPCSGLVTIGEIKACLDVAAGGVARAELSDPSGWADLKAHPDRAAARIRQRLATGRSPAAAQVFPWPKDRMGMRPMAWLDPFDQIADRAMVGRRVNLIVAAVCTWSRSRLGPGVDGEARNRSRAGTRFVCVNRQSVRQPAHRAVWRTRRLAHTRVQSRRSCR